jgi:chemotaxis signal transduction protein
MLGVIHVQGRIFPLFDLAVLFGAARSTEEQPRQIITLSHGEYELALRVHRVTGVRWLARQELETVLPDTPDIPARCAAGITPDGLVILDVATLLAEEAIRTGAWGAFTPGPD